MSGEIVCDVEPVGPFLEDGPGVSLCAVHSGELLGQYAELADRRAGEPAADVRLLQRIPVLHPGKLMSGYGPRLELYEIRPGAL